MSELETTRLCAEAMGIDVTGTPPNGQLEPLGSGVWLLHSRLPYDPLHEDAQAMALVKRFMLRVDAFSGYCGAPILNNIKTDCLYDTFSDVSLNHAICECVAKRQLDKMQREKSK